MNYYNIYKQLIKKRLKQPATQQYTQKHHILPRSISSQSKDIVILSAREHFIAHALLVKITEKSQNKENYYKMVYAFQNMNRNGSGKRYINSHLYQLLKCKYSEIRKQLIKQFNPSKDKMWIYNLELEQSKTIDKDQQIPEGWIKGRIQDFKLYKSRLQKKEKSKQKREQIKQQKTKKAEQYFEYYKLYGYKGIVQKYNYQRSDVSLRKIFNRWCKEQYDKWKKLKKRYSFV